MKRVILLILVLVLFGVGVSTWSRTSQPSPTPQMSITPQKAPSDYVTYMGEDGMSAYQILVEKEHAWLENDSSGLIISINGRKADPDKKEFWAFYVNGEMAQVGAAEYITKGTDKIEWKIETY